MATLNLWVHINAQPERVWEILADLPSQKRWMVDLRSLEFTNDQREGEGAVVHVTSELFGLPLVKDRMRITKWQPPNRFDVEHIGQFTGTGEFILQPVAGRLSRPGGKDKDLAPLPSDSHATKARRRLWRERKAPLLPRCREPTRVVAFVMNLAVFYRIVRGSGRPAAP